MYKQTEFERIAPAGELRSMDAPQRTEKKLNIDEKKFTKVLN
jgi:hypothetical protein